ncbi:MAG: DUF3467 domain-containing protein [Desulfobulbaceae bacterium]|nr:DUF3467 domain-containing protein [Desulfobulbaceae bacterium]
MRVKVEDTFQEKSPSKGDELQAFYANSFRVGYNAYEFVLDFGQFFPENGEEQYHARIITNPNYVESLLGILKEAIEQYQKKHGHLAGD